jgi:anti-repressor protein
MEDPTIPCIDARRLWSQLGKPHSRFNQWADYHLKQLLSKSKLNTEISVFEDSSKAGKPTKEYTLSRSLAASLAMQAGTDEGDEVRAYFQDMERIVFKMAEYNSSRAETPSRLDRRLNHAALQRAGKAFYVSHVKQLQGNLCKILTGMNAGQIKAKYGKRVRDILQHDLTQLDVYNEAYAIAIRMYAKGTRWVKISPFLKQYFSGLVNVAELVKTL